MCAFSHFSEKKELFGAGCPLFWYIHLTRCGDADLHNSLTSAFSEHFPHKTEEFA